MLLLSTIPLFPGTKLVFAMSKLDHHTWCELRSSLGFVDPSFCFKITLKLHSRALYNWYVDHIHGYCCYRGTLINTEVGAWYKFIDISHCIIA